jgi:hypothetical protein
MYNYYNKKQKELPMNEEYEDYNYDTECGSGAVACTSSCDTELTYGEVVAARKSMDDFEAEEDNYDTDGRV